MYPYGLHLRPPSILQQYNSQVPHIHMPSFEHGNFSSVNRNVKTLLACLLGVLNDSARKVPLSTYENPTDAIRLCRTYTISYDSARLGHANPARSHVSMRARVQIRYRVLARALAVFPSSTNQEAGAGHNGNHERVEEHNTHREGSDRLT